VLCFLALTVLGIIFTIMFYLVVPVIIIEDAGVLESLSRSRRLVSNRWFKTFILSLIVIIIVFFVSFVGNLIGSPLGAFSWLVSSIIAAFVEPILPISTTVYYYSMAERRLNGGFLRHRLRRFRERKIKRVLESLFFFQKPFKWNILVCAIG
ncbi:MAG: hypothetical protein ACP5ER_00815, partial [Candidatus Bathyarchaeales archaeon]